MPSNAADTEGDRWISSLDPNVQKSCLSRILAKTRRRLPMVAILAGKNNSGLER